MPFPGPRLRWEGRGLGLSEREGGALTCSPESLTRCTWDLLVAGATHHTKILPWNPDSHWEG